MLKVFSLILSNATARNPLPVFIFSLVFFGGIAVSFLDKTPVPGPRFNEELANSRREQAQRQAMAYCDERKMAPYSLVMATVDKEKFSFSCPGPRALR
ncbi:hypothetical protein ACVIGB_000385 [Bradyrhizobium sp. USDA 4341]